MNSAILNRRSMLAIAASAVLVVGCNTPEANLSELDIPAGSNVATFSVIDGM